MSFVTIIRDYVETLNTISESLGQNITPTNFFYETVLYFLKTLQTVFLYIVTFQWIRDFTLLPLVLPQFSAAILKETFVLESPSKIFFEFLEIPDLHQNKFLLGFFNSFFLTLPFSVVHLVSVRRLLLQGIPAAVSSMAGYLLGQILFLTCIIFGLRFILVPWLTLEPLSYVLGLILLFRTCFSLVTENVREYRGWKNPKYKEFFLTSFGLAWCEQTSLFQYFGNLTFSSNVTSLESFSSTSLFSSFLTHILYLLGISFGALIFTGLWGFFFFNFKELCYKVCYLVGKISQPTFDVNVHRITVVFAIALSLTSIPFYAFDYLIAAPLGFVSQDKVFKNTPFGQSDLKTVGNTFLASGLENDYKYISIDTSYFDARDYLTMDKVPQLLSFEDLNYRGERDWILRYEKQDSVRMRKTGNFTVKRLFNLKSKEKPPFQDINPDFNSVIPQDEQLYQLGSTVVDLKSPSVERFVNEFQDKYSTSGPKGEDNGEEAQSSEDKNSYPVIYQASFPTDAFRKSSPIKGKLEPRLKQKLYSNPVYRNLLALEIDSFLNRQPQSFKLSATQERDLFEKRQALESYYDSLRQYSNLPYSEEFETLFDGTKSFSTKVYNQQFKGTLRSVRRLFSLTVNNNEPEKTILKFDQPNYQFGEKNSFSAYHEELALNQTLSGFGENQVETGTKNELFTKPFYAGWDEHTRKFVITNKFIPRNWAGYKVNVDPTMRRLFTQEKQKQEQKIKFTTWPLSQEKIIQFFNQKEDINTPARKARIPYITLFRPVTDFTQGFFPVDPQTTSSFPANFQRYENQVPEKDKYQIPVGKTDETEEQKQYREKFLKHYVVPERFPNLAPNRGGFIWPGNTPFDSSFLFSFLDSLKSK